MEFKKMVNNVHEGDCLEIMKNIPDGTIDMILCDLPYGTTRNEWDSIIDLKKLWKEYKRIIKHNGAIVLTGQGLFTAKLIIEGEKLFKYKIVWIKSKATNFLNASKQPLRKHEDICIFYKQQPIYNPQMTSGHVRKVSSAKKRSACIERRNLKEDYIYNKEYADKVNDYDSTDRFPRNVLRFASDKQRLAIHPTQTPKLLIEYFIKTYSNEGDTILDPCRGVNGVAVCADRLNRKAILIEKDEKFYNMGLIRREFPQLKTKEIKKKYFEIYNLDYDL